MNYHSRVTIRRAPGVHSTQGLLVAGQHFFRCALGRSAMTAFKREGDGATPAPLTMVPQWGYFRTDRVARPQTAIAMRATAKDDGWCDAPTHPAYNEPVRLPFSASHEVMLRDDVLYDVCIVLDQNRSPNARKRYGGSAIFLHCAKPGLPPTAGCIALPRAQLIGLLARMSCDTRIVVQP